MLEGDGVPSDLSAMPFRHQFAYGKNTVVVPPSKRLERETGRNVVCHSARFSQTAARAVSWTPSLQGCVGHHC